MFVFSDGTEASVVPTMPTLTDARKWVTAAAQDDGDDDDDDDDNGDDDGSGGGGGGGGGGGDSGAVSAAAAATAVAASASRRPQSTPGLGKNYAFFGFHLVRPEQLFLVVLFFYQFTNYVKLNLLNFGQVMSLAQHNSSF